LARLRIAHLSDLHLGPLPRPAFGALMSKRVFGYVNTLRPPLNILDEVSSRVNYSYTCPYLDCPKGGTRYDEAAHDVL